MLQKAVVLPARRRALRRSVHVNCDVITKDWEEPSKHLATDLSPFGCWIDTPFPLAPESEVVLAFTPPRWQPMGEVVTFARVRRRIRTGPRRGMGLEFLDVSRPDIAAMTRSLRGLPPPLCTSRQKAAQELVWVDSLLTWEEDLGDRINTFTVSDMLGMIAEDAFEDIEALAEPLGEIAAA